MSRLYSQPQQLSCPICYQPFNSSTNPSTVICSNNHSICAQCVGSLQSFKCPFCRTAINFGQAAANQLNQNLANQPSSVVQQQASNNRLNNNAWYNLIKIISSICSDKLWFLLIGIHSVLLLFDIIFAVSDNDPTCVDNQYSLLLTFRQFSFLKEFWGLFNFTFFLINLILWYVCEWIYEHRIRFVVCFFLLFIGKVVCWAIIQPILFFTIVKDHCSGGIYAYGLIQVVLHTFIIPIFGIVNKKRSIL